MHIALIAVYLSAVVAGLAIVNADQNDALAFYGLVAAASLLLGWVTGSPWWVIAAVLLIPLAVPFGETNEFTGGDDTSPMVVLAQVGAILSALSILLGAGMRRLHDRRRATTASYRGAE